MIATSAHRRRASLDGERGETLVELIITIFLVGLVVLGLAGLLFTIIKASVVNRTVVRSANATVEVAEAVERLEYQPCGGSVDPADFYQSGAGFSLPGYEATITDVRYLHSQETASESFDDSCPGSDQGVQEITVRLEEEDGPINEELVFYKRSAVCPAQNLEYEGQQC